MHPQETMSRIIKAANPNSTHLPPSAQLLSQLPIHLNDKVCEFKQGIVRMQQTAERVRKRENVNGNEQHQQDGVIDMNTPVRSNNEFDADTLK